MYIELRPIGRQRRRWEDKIRRDMEEMNWRGLIQDRIMWRNLSLPNGFSVLYASYFVLLLQFVSLLIFVICNGSPINEEKHLLY